MHDSVIVVGAGPVGLMLAAELRLGGVGAVVLEQLPARDDAPKANGLVGQVVQVLHHRGLYQRLTGKPGPPKPSPAYMFGGLSLPIDPWDGNPLHALPLPQWDLETGLAERAAELGADIRRGHRVTGFEQDDDAVTAHVVGPDGEYQLRAPYLVGCDGGHSAVRKTSGIDFPGVTSDRVTSRTAHVVLPASMLVAGMLDLPSGRLAPFAYHRTNHGVFVFASFQPGLHLVSCMEWDEPPVADDEPVTLAEVQASMRRVLGVDIPVTAPTGPGRYQLRRLASRNTRLAERYRAGRVLLAGDAAHVHSAIGGPGLNLGLQDVVNLGWKLAADVRGWAPAGLLDTYSSERRPLAERVVLHSQAQSALLAPGDQVTALRTLFGELLDNPANVRHLAAMLAGADIRYSCGGSGRHPLLGRWVPDLPLTVAGQPTRLAELAHHARPILLDLADDPLLAEVVVGWADRVDHVVASAEQPPADAVLIRPDGYAAWIADDDPARRPATLAAALTTWFGEPVTVTGSAGSFRHEQ
ncbi:MAG TPA: FAD-dependent monooxygenase [Pseudonocardiaceae bacterium]|nr:FAD-dependent monooxygenase [Pseudonocardiaceae bacterium]